MNGNDLMKAMGFVDDRFINEAEYGQPVELGADNENHKPIEYERTKKKPVFLKWGILAACLCVCALLGFGAWRGGVLNKPLHEPDNGSKTQLSTTASTAQTQTEVTTPTTVTSENETDQLNASALTTAEDDEKSGGNELPTAFPPETGISITGTGFTEDEIEKYIEENSDFLMQAIKMEGDVTPSSVSVCKKGYSHISYGEKNTVNLDAVTLPILVNGKIYAHYELVRVNGETVGSLGLGGNKWQVYNDTLFGNPESEVLFCYLGDTAFEFMVLPDNSIVYPVSDVTDDTENLFNNDVNWYSLFKTPYNTLSAKDLTDPDSLVSVFPHG